MDILFIYIVTNFLILLHRLGEVVAMATLNSLTQMLLKLRQRL